jgi:hypothetical protein
MKNMEIKTIKKRFLYMEEKMKGKTENERKTKNERKTEEDQS